jgi:hypothetical protein
LEVTDYQHIRKHIIKLGKQVEVKQRAKQLQSLLSEGDAKVPYRDAVEMAYNELLESNRLY